MHVRGALALAAASLVTLAPARALAWQEAHQTGDDVEVRIDPDGKASFRHKLVWHVVRGPLKSIEVANVDPAAEIEGDVPITAEDGRSLVAHAARLADHDGNVVRITVDEPRAIMRGTFSFALSLHVDLASSHALTRDGGTWRLGWSSPVADDGFDGARTTLVVPSAPEPPRPIVADTGAVDDSVVATLRRDPSQDSLELVRPHVARGEAVGWTVRVDPRAFPLVSDPRLRTPPPSRTEPEPNRVSAASLVAGLAAIALVYGWLVARRARAAAGPGQGTDPDTMSVASRWALARAAVAGLAAAGGVWLQLARDFTAGAVCLAIALLAASIRAPDRKAPPRGPGRWLVISPEEAFAAGPASRRRTLVLVALGLLAVSAVLVARAESEVAWLAVIDASLLVPLLLDPGGEPFLQASTRMASRWLERVFRRLVAGKAPSPLRVSPWARVVTGGAGHDELRLLILPRAAMPGVLGVEVGLAWASTPVGWAASPEVLARVLEESPAAARLARELPQSRALPGRRPDERVVRVLPLAPTEACTVALVQELADRLTDRRVSVPRVPWTGEERRESAIDAAPDRAA
jgi:hypothetical protein